MKAYIYPSGIRISPFNEPVSEALIRNQTLEWWQTEALQRAGLTPARVQSVDEVKDDSGLLLSDHVFLSAELLKKFCALGAKRSGLYTLALSSCGFTQFTTPVQDVLYEPVNGSPHFVYHLYTFNKTRPTPLGLETAIRIPLSIKEKRVANDRVARVTEGRLSFEYFPTREFIFHINRWSHLLYANLYSIYHYWAQPSAAMAMRFLWSVIKAHSFNRWKIAGQMNRKGIGCDIHPSAVVEGSVLGDGVKIGRHAAVFGSWLGDGVEIASGAEVIGSVLGEQAVAGNSARLVYCVLYPRALIGHQPLQGCVVGRGTVATPASYLFDMKLGKDIKVDYQDRRVSVGKSFLGSCLGHHAFIGPGIWFEAGLEIPNGYIIVRDPEQIVRYVPKELPPGVPLMARGNTIMLRPPSK